MKIEFKKYIFAIFLIYILHLVVANWLAIKQIFVGNYVGDFVFVNVKLLTICIFLFLIIEIVKFNSNKRA